MPRLTRSREFVGLVWKTNHDSRNFSILQCSKQLFAAAERVLVRDGPDALTSRAVTTEAGCAKGVLHRHFADFDAFLAELVLATTPTGIPLLTEAAAMIAAYLTAERSLGRIAPDADIDTLAPTLIGAAHMLFTGPPPNADDVERVVRAVISPA